MAAGGCAIPCPVDRGGILTSLISDITVAFPGSDLYYVPYNSSIKQGAIAAKLMVTATHQYVAQCPNTPIVYLGWSLGGVVVMSTVCGGVAPQFMKKNVIAAIAYGEETYVGGQSYNAGTCQNNAVRLPPRSSSLSHF